MVEVVLGILIAAAAMTAYWLLGKKEEPMEISLVEEKSIDDVPEPALFVAEEPVVSKKRKASKKVSKKK
jgi:hypothetical protein